MLNDKTKGGREMLGTKLSKKVVLVVVSLVMIGAFTFNNSVTITYAFSKDSVDTLRPKNTSGDIKEVMGFLSETTLKKKGVRIRTELTEPEDQPKGFFTNDYHGYRIAELLKEPLEQIPDAVVNAVRKKLDKDRAEGKILSAVVIDSGATDIDIHVTHRYGELNAAVQRLILEAMKEGCLKAQELGLLRKGTDIASMDLRMLGRILRVKYQSHSITERGSEPVVMAKIIGAGIGAADIKLYHEFFMPGATPLQKLGFVPVVDLAKDKLPVRGFRAIVRRTEDVLKGNFDGPVWEFEKSAAVKVITKEKKEILYPSKDESLELMALASQPNDFLITAVYTVEGSTLPSTEPLVSVVYQPVYGEEGNLRTLNPTFICRSQSGADAVGGVASMFYDVNFVPGGPNGERYVVTKPVTLKEARKAPPEGVAHVVVYGWQSKDNGVIPTEKDGVMDHVAINPPALGPERKLADWLASIMTTHQFDQPYLTPFAAQEQVEPLRKKQSHLFTRAPKEADIDSAMDAVEEKVASGEYLSVTDDKADMGGKFGHNFTPEYMLAIDRATAMEAVEKEILSDGNITGFIDKMRLKRGTTVSIGDDSHIIMVGDKSRNSAESHQLSFLAFTRGYYAAVVNGEKPYGLAQDYQGKEAKAAKANPVFYSHFTSRFFEILRQVMPLDYMGMVDKMEEGWKKWQETSETVKLPEPFSGNVSQQGIGSARYLVDIASGERTLGKLAGDKCGPAALNRIIREGVYAALAAGEFANGLVFEIWDAKAFDEHGNIPVNEIPEAYADIADAVNELKDKAGQDFVKACYKNGSLIDNLSAADKEKLAALIKKSGFVPTKRIYLDAQQDKEAIYLYLADSDRFNIKQVWSKKQPDWEVAKSKGGWKIGQYALWSRSEGYWDINNPQEYLDRPILGSSVTKLGILAGGEYIGKDDPVMLGSMKVMKHIFEFAEKNPILLQGDMNGSHWLAGIPTAFKYAVANKESHPILVGMIYTLSEDGKTLAKVEDVFGKKEYAPIRNRMFKFDFEFKKAQLGGQFEPYGTNWRTVEASYPLAKLLRALQAPDSAFLVKNKPVAERESRPIGMFGGAVVDLFQVASIKGKEDTGKYATAYDGGQTFQQLWGAYGIVAEQIPELSSTLPVLRQLNQQKDGAAFAYMFDSDYVARNLEAVMAVQNMVEQIGGKGNIKLVLHINKDKVDGKELLTNAELDQIVEDDLAKINERNRKEGGKTKLTRDMFAAVVVGENPQDVAKQVAEKVGADAAVQVIGSEDYVNRFKDVIKVRIVLDKAGAEQMASLAKAIRLAEAITERAVKGETVTAEQLSQLDALIDGEGTFHVRPIKAVEAVSTLAKKYETDISELGIKI